MVERDTAALYTAFIPTLTMVTAGAVAKYVFKVTDPNLYTYIHGFATLAGSLIVVALVYK